MIRIISLFLPFYLLTILFPDTITDTSNIIAGYYTYSPSGWVIDTYNYDNDANNTTYDNIELRITSFSSNNENCKFDVRKRDGSNFGSSVTIYIRKGTPYSSLATSISVNAGTNSNDSNYYNYASDVGSSDQDYYAILSVGGTDHIAGPVTISYNESNDAPNLSTPSAGTLGADNSGHFVTSPNGWDDYRFQVIYSDGDNDYPAIKKVWLLNGSTEIDKVMIGSTGIPSGGERYYYDLDISQNIGSSESSYDGWEYKFEFNDGTDLATGIYGIEYQIPYIKNNQTQSSADFDESVQFSIDYYCDDGAGADTRRIYYKRPSDSGFDNYYTLTSTGGSPANGITYYRNIQLDEAGTWEYKFDFFENSNYSKALGSGKVYEIEVGNANNPPVLSTLQAGELNGIDYGHLVRSPNGWDDFQFQIKCTDQNGDVPSTRKVWLLNGNTEIDKLMSIGSGNYTSGRGYFYTLDIGNDIGPNESYYDGWKYKFDFHDGTDQATGLNGIEYEIPYLKNNQTPSSASLGESVQFLIDYYCDDGQYPETYKIHLKQPGNSSYTLEYSMSGSGSASSGRNYNKTVVLNTAGTWTYKFDFHENSNYAKALGSGKEYTIVVTDNSSVISTPQVGQYGIVSGQNFNMVRTADNLYKFQVVYQGAQVPTIKVHYRQYGWYPPVDMTLSSGSSTNGLYTSSNIYFNGSTDFEYKFESTANGIPSTGIAGTNNSLIYNIPRVSIPTVQVNGSAVNISTVYTRKSNSTVNVAGNSDADPTPVYLYYRLQGASNWSSPYTMSANLSPTNANCENGVTYSVTLNPPTSDVYEFKIDAHDDRTKALLSGNIYTFSSNNCIVTTPSTSDGEFHTAACYLIEEGIINPATDVDPWSPIIRQDLAKIAFLGVFDDAASPAENFPTYFYDLQQASDEYHDYAIALSHLEFQDGIPPFSREFLHFNPGNQIKRRDILKVFLETFNIAPNGTGTSPFTDVANDHPLYGYIKKAWDLGIITNATFNPDLEATRGEAFVMLYRILTNNSIAKPSPSQLQDIGNYFVPLNITLENAGSSHNLLEGVFKTYPKGGLYLDDRGIDLNFNINYNAYSVEMPREIQTIRPLGFNWNHSYNYYLLEVDAAHSSNLITETDYVVEVKPSGSFRIFEDDGNNYPAITLGVYDDLEKTSSTEYKLTTKHGIEYTFTYQMEDEYDNKAYMLTSIKDRNANELIIVYGNGVAEPDMFGNTNPTKRISYVQAPSGRKFYFYYTNGNHLNQVFDNSISRVVRMYYTDDNISSFRDAEDRYTFYSYDTTGSPHTSHLLTNITLPEGNNLAIDYEERKLSNIQSAGANLEYDIDPLGGVTTTTLTSDNQPAQPKVFEYQYNTFINHIENITEFDPVNANPDPDAVFTYASSVHPTLPTEINDKGLITQFQYDANGNVLEKLVGTISTSYTYGAFNLLETYSDGESNETSITRDAANGNITSIENGMLQTTSISNYWYGYPQNITNPEGIAINISYNPYGNPTNVSAPEEISITHSYDNASRRTGTVYGASSTSFSYDKVNNLIGINDGLGADASYQYDDNDNLIKIISPNNKETDITYNNQDLPISVNFEGVTRGYDYHNDGSLDTYTRPSGTVMDITYDDEGKLIDNSYATFEYHTTGVAENKIQKISNDYGDLEFTYDGYKRLNSTLDEHGNNVIYEYDDNSNITKMTYPDGKETTYTYNAINQLTEVKFEGSTIVDYVYRDDGLLIQEAYGNSTSTNYTYDAAGRMISKSIIKSNGAVIASYTYTLDATGKITSENVVEPYTTFPPMIAATYNYTYNPQNRIQSVTDGTNTVSFSIDDDGNTISKTDYPSISYNEIDRLTQFSTTNYNASYEYDGLGMLRTATRGGTYTRYILDVNNGLENIIAEANSSNNISQYYIHGLGLIARVKADGTIHYYHHNYQGSTIAMTNASQAITHKYQYEDFGRITQMEEPANDLNRFRYVGKYGVMYETEDLYFMRARFYDNTIGRFFSEDPIWSNNLYAYGGNDAVNYIDATGGWKTKAFKYVFGQLKKGGKAITVFFAADATANHIQEGEYCEGVLEVLKRFTGVPGSTIIKYGGGSAINQGKKLCGAENASYQQLEGVERVGLLEGIIASSYHHYFSNDNIEESGYNSFYFANENVMLFYEKSMQEEFDYWYNNVYESLPEHEYIIYLED